uniref:Uncharacterized protein n=1 Tax=Alexandrium catenella TaxID=2925 RepID=A0A7S1MNU7_ALECA
MGAVLAAMFLEPGRAIGDNGDSHLDAATRTEHILNSFYSDLQKRHARERECLEEHQGAAFTTMLSRKWNQQEVYLDIEKRTQARAASRKYLERHSEWLSGPGKVGDVALHDLVAVQHYIDLDVEDLSLPEDERRNSDAFGGPDGNVCEPFLRDATRCSSIVVDGRKFSFQARCAREGVTQKNTDELQQCRKAFLDELSQAVMQSLGREGQALPLLVRAVTSAMSQSGLASVERACYSSQVVVCGGDQTVRYKLQQREGNSWDVTLSVQKVGFEDCIICSQFFEDPVTVPCSPKSFVSKACTIRFTVLENNSHVQADVVKLRKEMCLVNVYGSLSTGHALQQQEPFERPRPALDPEDRRGRELPCKGADESTDTGGEDEDGKDGPQKSAAKPGSIVVLEIPAPSKRLGMVQCTEDE